MSHIPSHTPRILNHGIYNGANFDSHNKQFADYMHADGSLFALRVLGCSDPSDVIQIDRRSYDDGTYQWLAEHLGSVGLGVSANIVTDVTAELAQDYPRHELSVYEFGPGMNSVRPDPKRFEATIFANNKNSFIGHAAMLGSPVPETLFVDDISKKPTPEELAKLTLPRYYKPNSGALGVGLKEIEDGQHDELIKIVAAAQGPFQLQQTVEDDPEFFNAQYRVEDGVAQHVTTSKQIVDGETYIGTERPAELSLPEISPITQPVADSLHEMGLKDCYNFDVAVTKSGRVFLIECNARWSASTYPNIIAGRLGVRGWATRTIGTTLDRAADLTVPDDLVYDASRPDSEDPGVIVINNSQMSSKRPKYRAATVMVTGSAEAQQEALVRMREQLKEPAKIAA